MVQNERLLEIVITQLGKYLLTHNSEFKNGTGTLTIDEPHMLRYRAKIGDGPTLLAFGYDLSNHASNQRYLGKIALKEIPNSELLEKILDNGTIPDSSNPNREYGWCIAEVPSTPHFRIESEKQDSKGIIATIKEYFKRLSK